MVGNYLHSKFLDLNGIDIALDEYMWVEWGSAFVIASRLQTELSACSRREHHERLGF